MVLVGEWKVTHSTIGSAQAWSWEILYFGWLAFTVLGTWLECMCVLAAMFMRRLKQILRCTNAQGKKTETNICRVIVKEKPSSKGPFLYIIGQVH